MTEPKARLARRARATPTVATEERGQKRINRPHPPAGLPADDEAKAKAKAKAKAVESPAASTGPAGKLGVVVALMLRPEGVTVAQMGEATGWQSHSVRGALAGSLKRRHGLTIVSDPGESGRVYRIAQEQVA